MSNSEELAQQVLAYSKFHRVQDYVARGREFSGLTDESLRDGWIVAYTAYVENPDNRSLRQKSSDLGYEFQLRKTEPPYSKVTTQTEALKAWGIALAERVWDDPDLMQALAMSFGPDLERLEEDSTKPRS